MKRIIGIVAFVCFSFSLNAENLPPTQPDCVALAIDVFDAYYENGFSYYQSYQASNWAYEGCVSNGGDPGSVVVLD